MVYIMLNDLHTGKARISQDQSISPSPSPQRKFRSGKGKE